MQAVDAGISQTALVNDELDAVVAAWTKDHLCSECEAELTWRDRAYCASRPLCKRCKQREHESELRGVYVRFEGRTNRAQRRASRRLRG